MENRAISTVIFNDECKMWTPDHEKNIQFILNRIEILDYIQVKDGCISLSEIYGWFECEMDSEESDLEIFTSLDTDPWVEFRIYSYAVWSNGRYIPNYLIHIYLV